MQSCIQRFRSRRRLQPEHTTFFNEYLFLGGIDTSKNAFGGLDPKHLKELTPAERRDFAATDAVHAVNSADERFYSGDDDHWVVDFTGVAAGFFSTPLLQLTGGNVARMCAAADVVANFLRYVLQHDVCPEYEADVKRALQLCSDAKEEWPAVNALLASLPGAFNLAATDLFSPPVPGDWACPAHPRPDDLEPKTVFYGVCAFLGEDEALASAQRRGPKAVDEYECTMQVVDVQRPSADLAAQFKRLRVGGSTFKLEPVGKAQLRPAMIEDGWVTPARPVPVGEQGLWLFFEDSILANLRPGMKMALVVVELDVGISFVKAIRNLVPTHYTFLAQELMKHYKVPRVNERPAPSVRDPGAEERQHQGDAGEG